ncbi:MAG: hypothetical protein A2802_01400 [Candidatus Woykebacteria bacterium RIFCSPHIGHO2_01_FULL_43_29]|uniref:Cell envelope-related transcriptional attenuator domain-containing protein n=2 Tax=Candidatus Woykeibacteriota TaxID=1817899 RepID=A0A1G1WT28_9BACT|nr:MAG: hypothetical protein A2802_01400 [Candidatus Woykebacteria bacterium RIFCSPHIGHO2_01_FULL_43_29]OGY28795.1 MAG: hypothetical protein A3J50_03545 [Candidatus Woykebacteria bacterium RIFCSPHIGHO2_02_FULL_43_16b]OGY30854.1 MAG: hypothetical protein A3A61_04470 [Candidatus Woykebacteria bacterium RIFCSPLOWO2_01_FULL_43_14]
MRYVDLSSNYPKKRKTNTANLKYLKLTLAISGLFLLFYALYLLFWPTTMVVKQIFQSPGSALSFFRGDATLKSSDGRTNVLLLGLDKRLNEPYSYKDKTGTEFQNGFRSDTMVVLSLDHKTKDTVMVSLPRDLWVKIPKGNGVLEQHAKINAAYSIGNMSNYPGGGLALAEKVVSQHLGIPIHYGMSIDFEGFKKIVDTLGGVMVNVENSFEDWNYPVEGREYDPCGGDERYLCRYEHIKFEAGTQYMDGGSALKYVRSRSGTNGEGSDFARARRQQRLLVAIRNKALTWQTLSDPLKVGSLVSRFGQTIQTDFDINLYPQVYKILSEIDLNNVRSFVLDPSAKEGMIMVPPPDQYGGAYVLVPRKADWSEVQKYVSDALMNVVTTDAPQ